MGLEVDVIIVGQGLAGTAVAWDLWKRGRSFWVIDRGEAMTSSRVAAGLITPISGQKLVKTWMLEETWPVALAFYRSIEAILGCSFFLDPTVYRILDNQAEVDQFMRRRADGQYQGWITEGEAALPVGVEPGLGHFQMARAGRLDTITYLNASREFFRENGCYVEGRLDTSQDVERVEGGVLLPKWDVRGRSMVFCHGYAAASDPWFGHLAFKPAKGEILTVAIPGWDWDGVVHRSGWLVGLGRGRYRVGATYDWARLDHEPTEEGRAEILGKVARMTGQACEVLGHEAAIRPVHRQQFPVWGVHPEWPQVAYLNGLGSKGTLYAPYFAGRLLDQLETLLR